MDIIRIPIDELTPDPNNAKDHPKWQVEQIRDSIERFGNLDPIGVWGDDNLIIEGHGRYLALKDLGYNEAECIRLDWLDEDERRAYALVHNKLTMNSGFIPEELDFNLAAIEGIDMSLFGFDTEELDELEAEEDDYEIEEELEAKAKLGQIYQLGSHRLMCGDSTNADDVKKLVNGTSIDLCVTDPPYNVNVESENGLKIKNDNMGAEEFDEFLLACFKNMQDALKPGGAFYIWHASSTQMQFERALNKAGLAVRQQLIWNKSGFTFGRQDYQWKHEVCFYGWKGGAAHYFVDDRTQSTVFEDARVNVRKLKKVQLQEMLENLLSERVSTTVIDEQKPIADSEHPTMKPIKLIGRHIKNSSRIGENVLDLFGGSGTTLIACEQLNRSCLMMEYDPHYADVIIDRWEKLTGRKAVLLDE